MSGLVASTDELNYSGFYVQEGTTVLSNVESLLAYIPVLPIPEGSAKLNYKAPWDIVHRGCVNTSLEYSKIHSTGATLHRYLLLYSTLLISYTI